MKKVFFLFYSTLILSSLYAQSPEAFNYQGVARDVIGTPLANTTISLRISIIQDSPPGTTVYTENHFILTNKLGLFNIEVGRGSNPTGQFSDIKWGDYNHYILIEMDESGGTNFQYLGTSQLLSVPYALYAGNVSGGVSKWLDNSLGIHYNNGNVGIGTDNPIDKLTILGNDPVGDARYYLSLNNLSTSNRSYAMMRLTAGQPNSYTYLSHHSESYDFDGDKYTDFGQLESTGRGLILRASAPEGVIKFLVGGTSGGPILPPFERMRIDANGHVGIGTENPVDKLTIEGTDPVGDNRFYLSLNNHSLSNRSYAMMRITAGQPNSYTYLSHHAETYDYEGDKYTDFGQLESTGRGLILRASAVDGVIKFLVGGKVSSVAERMRINEIGNIGIGTDKPNSRLQVANGDIFVEDINSGVIMKSPNGSCWRMTINDNGSINTTSIPCPN